VVGTTTRRLHHFYRRDQAFEAHRLVRAMVGESAGCDARAPETVQHRCSNSPGRGGHPGHFVDARAHVDGRRIACTSAVFRDPKRTGSTGRTGDPLVTRVGALPAQGCPRDDESQGILLGCDEPQRCCLAPRAVTRARLLPGESERLRQPCERKRPPGPIHWTGSWTSQHRARGELGVDFRAWRTGDLRSSGTSAM
jgi:hypothetical protein